MKDYSLMFVLIDDLIDEVTNLEENLIVIHKINQVMMIGRNKKSI